MITTERQYRITKAAAERFAQALAHEEQGAHLDPRLRHAMREGIESELEILREQLAEYEALRSGRIAVLELDSLTALPDALIRARIAAGLTQKELATRLGLKEQQIQRYEATAYASASLRRITEIMQALQLQIADEMLLRASRR